MNQLTEKDITCPYCGEVINVLVEPADMAQQYIEDCQVCCKPINFSISENMSGGIYVHVYSDDDGF